MSPLISTLLPTIAVAGGVLFIGSLVMFLLARVFRDNSVMDIGYGLLFFVTAVVTASLTNATGTVPAIIIGCIGAWAARLSGRILRKNFGKPEDARYAAWREEWTKRGRLYFWLRSYVQINLLQSVIILVVLLPALIAISYPAPYVPWLLYLGIGVFIFGLTYETLADQQLDAFIARKKAGQEAANVMTSGLFRFSRRPNYFGEATVWWGLALACASVPYGWLAFASPLLITYILTEVTGPMLEASFKKKYPEEYAAYADRTNYFIPGPPKPQD